MKRKSILAVIILGYMLFLLCSCTSVRKASTKTESKIDSTHVVKSESIVKTDSSGTKETASKNDYERETTYVYDTDTLYMVNDVPRIKYITVKEKGKTEYIIKEVASKSSEAVKKDLDSTQVKTASKASASSTEKTRVPFWLWIMVLIILAGGGAYAYKKFVA